MWKTAFCLGMMLSLKTYANSCNINTVEGMLMSLKDNRKELLVNTKELAQAQNEKEARLPRPEVSLGVEGSKDSFKENEMTAEVLFNIDDYRKFDLLKKEASTKGRLLEVETQTQITEEAIEAGLTLFNSSQNREFLKRIESVERVIDSSVKNYEKRSIKSRDEEITLISLQMMKKNISLKKAMLLEEIATDKEKLSVWKLEECDLNSSDLSNLISEIESYKTKVASDSLKLRELSLKKEALLLESDLNYKNRFSNLKIGPTFARDNLSGEKEIRFGVALSFDFPSFDQGAENSLREKAITSAQLQKKYSEEVYSSKKRILEQRIEKHLKMIKTFSINQKSDDEIGKIKKIFDQGVLSPVVYIDSYRNYLDSVESVMKAQSIVFETHLKLRGFYEENNLF